jgi:hypothetical protein
MSRAILIVLGRELVIQLLEALELILNDFCAYQVKGWDGCHYRAWDLCTADI